MECEKLLAPLSMALVQQRQADLIFSQIINSNVLSFFLVFRLDYLMIINGARREKDRGIRLDIFNLFIYFF